MTAPGIGFGNVALLAVVPLLLAPAAAALSAPPALGRFGPPRVAAAAASASSRCWDPRTEEVGFARGINASRARADRGRLRLDPELSKTARVHTREMVDRTLLHHTSTTALGRRVTRWTMLGENVGVGFSVDSLHQAFMASPAHRANILLRSFRYVGVGTARAGDRLWVTVVFENRVDPGTRLRMPRC